MTSPLPKVRAERKSNRRGSDPREEERSDLTIGAETTIASQTMLAILQMAEEAHVDAPGMAAKDGDPVDRNKIWWINHPLMQRVFQLEDNIDDCYTAMKQIIEGNPHLLDHSQDLAALIAAIEEHKLKFPAIGGSRQLFNIIEIFFEERQTP